MDAEVTLDNLAYQSGNTPDVIASFGGRGPGVGDVLKPDILAPGVNILAQGYIPGRPVGPAISDADRLPAASMAAPHVTGAAALLRQIHPDWSNMYYQIGHDVNLQVHQHLGLRRHPHPASGYGRRSADLTHTADPGVILDSPSVSFGRCHRYGRDPTVDYYQCCYWL